MHKGGLSAIYNAAAFSLVRASCIYTVLSGAANRHFFSRCLAERVLLP
jgi:hypothetical protein